ncbi:hypothetical protein PoB_004269700 [Plakobranchus ocellatus]|uniref:Uncharacterized protein n=1 Tax=Plakobranchus ocellatus TaxID=259542 RepID=A0AAV4B9U9_9GAST|nr:hypothetical protein PoB_004269700 [Plakobranchus ocellatus]
MMMIRMRRRRIIKIIEAIRESRGQGNIQHAVGGDRLPQVQSHTFEGLSLCFIYCHGKTWSQRQLSMLEVDWELGVGWLQRNAGYEMALIFVCTSGDFNFCYIWVEACGSCGRSIGS